MSTPGIHIAVAGNIGAGKTTLVNKLAKHYGWQPHFESVDDNPYLEDFYEDMKSYAFPLQIFFLNSRFEQVKAIRVNGKNVIQDRTIYEDAHIFARNLHEAGNISKRDYDNYFRLFQSMTSMITPPDLLIYLKASIPVLVQRIDRRGRDYEESISIKYLENLNKHYDEWISKYDKGNLLVIDSDKLNIADKVEDFSQVVNKIDAELFGLFSQV